MKIGVLLILICFSRAWALETDNYLMWDKELKDSSSIINDYLVQGIEKGLQNSNNKNEPQSCLQVTKSVAQEFKSFLVHDNPVENFLMKTLTSDQIYPQNLNYVEISIYRDPYLVHIPAFGLSPNVQVNGFYFGTDKLSHFASTGMNYFLKYLAALKRNKTKREAEMIAIDYGVQDERTLHGYWASGVFSYADLEANYQGLKFYQNLCSLVKVNDHGKWELIKSPRIEDYVSGKWDETFYLSYRVKENWKKVSHILKQNYCDLAQSELVKRRMDYYKKNDQVSFSHSYLQTLKLPRPDISQSVDELCLTKF